MTKIGKQIKKGEQQEGALMATTATQNNYGVVDAGNRETQQFFAPRTPPASNKSPVIHTRAVVTSIIEKALVNLDVLAQVVVGDKLDWTASGHFVIQKPSYWTTALRMLGRTDRWHTLSHIQDVISTAETMEGVQDGERLRVALHKAIHGIRNLQMTYDGDVLMSSSLNVLLQRLGERYRLVDTELM